MSRQYGIPPGYSSTSGLPPAPPLHTQSPYRDASPVRGPAGQNDYEMNSMNGTPRDSDALRDVDTLYNPRVASPSPEPYGSELRPTPLNQQTYSQSSIAPLNPSAGNYSPPRSPGRTARRAAPALGGAAAGAGAGAGFEAASLDGRMPRGSWYHGDGYDSFDPNSIADDGDDGFYEQPRSRFSGLALPSAGGAAAGAGAGAGLSKAFGAGNPQGGNYGPVGADAEKSDWLSKQSSGNKRLKWIVGIAIALLVVGGIVGGVVGGILASRNSGGGSSSSGGGSNKGTHKGGLYDINSDEVQAVLGNDKLHKVFPAMDYTPNYAQYPQCLAKGGGPVQNNVTIDVAIMSQLTPAIRLYGTDCNQTELVLEAINRLQMQDTMKVWLGVYLNGNDTTDSRQLADMYNILDTYDHSSFVGVIVGNEVLYSKYLTATQLSTILEGVRSNFTSKGINLPVSTADLGDNWDASLAQASDIVMANVHPFFAGEVADDAAGWAYTFWTGNDVPLTTQKTAQVGGTTYPTQIISEIGWPSQGGNDCGDATSDTYGCTSTTDGAVAGIDNLNTFMDSWVCQAMNNGTTYFWFEAFDEPWKHQFDTAHNHWEPYWGLFDVDRNLKDGVTIPDCGGKTVDKAY